MIYLILGLVVVSGVLLKVMLSQAKDSGKVEVSNSTQEKAINDVKDDAIIRDNFQHNTAEHDRLQKRFQRD